MTEIFEQVAAVSEQMIQFNLHKDEFLLLQATVLVNAGELSKCLSMSFEMIDQVHQTNMYRVEF